MPAGGSRPRCTVDGCSAPHMGKGMCGLHLARFKRSGSTDDPREARFWAKVVKGGDLERPDCWVWVGARDRAGYGKQGNRKARRVVYEKLVGPVPAGRGFYHRCRNRACVNPDHMVQGYGAPAPERFWAKVERRGDTECWQWTAALGRGYGQFSSDHGRVIMAHRYSFILRYGAIPDGQELRHRCGNRGCVNPDHLVLAPQYEGFMSSVRARAARSAAARRGLE